MDFADRCENLSWAEIDCDATLSARGRDVLLVVAKVAYRLGDDGVQLAFAPIRRHEHADEVGGVRLPDDFAADHKPGTDVGLVGAAQPPPDGATSAACWLSVGELRKVVKVFGPRVYLKGWRGVVPGDPLPLQEPVPLRFDLAFGGVDAATGQAEPHNPVGRGFRADRERLVGALAPRLEPLAEGRAVHPAHAAFGPIPAHWEPRRALAGTHDDAWAERRAPVRPRDFDARHHCWAVPELWSPAPLAGDEPVEIGGIFPQPMRFCLPRYAVAFESQQDGARREHATHLDTFFIDTDRRLVELCWRAAIALPRAWQRLERVSVIGVGDMPAEVVPTVERRS